LDERWVLDFDSEEPADVMEMRNHSIPQNPNLMLAQFAQFFRHELLRFKELEHRRPAIMAREVVRRPRKSRWPRPVRHSTGRCLGKVRELTEPSREDGPELGVGGKPQKGVPWA